MQQFITAGTHAGDAGTIGDTDAFDTLYARYKDRTWRYFRRQLDDDAARDCQQELWMKLIERRAAYRAQGKFDAYLFSMAHSVLVDAQRKHLRVIDKGTDKSVVMETLQASKRSEPEQATTLARALTALKGAIAGLPTVQRNTFVLRQESGLSYAAIAEATDSSTETVKSRLRYARNKLTEELRQRLGPDFDTDFDKELDHAPNAVTHSHNPEESDHVHL